MIRHLFTKYWLLPLFISCIAFENYLPIKVNVTSSMPHGIYLLVHKQNVNRNDLVMICLNDSLANFAFHRGYLHTGICADGKEPLLKQVVGLEDDSVDISNNYVAINNIKLPHSETLAIDSHNRLLPGIPRGIYNLKENQLWLYGIDSERSWDSRYFGIANSLQVVSVVKPLLIWS